MSEHDFTRPGEAFREIIREQKAEIAGLRVLNNRLALQNKNLEALLSDYAKQLTGKDAEIERLKGVIAVTMSYKDIKSFEQESKDKDAEISRLKAVIESIDDHGRASAAVEIMKAQQELLASQQAELDRLKTLIADMLEWIEECGEATYYTRPLLDRAREAIK